MKTSDLHLLPRSTRNAMPYTRIYSATRSIAWLTFTCLSLLATAFPCTAQPAGLPEVPAESPLATITQRLGLGDVRLAYSRPNMKGRKIFGEQVPWGTVWRTGANTSTKFQIEEDLFMEGHRVPAGTYSLLSIPGQDKWTIILNTDTTLWGHYGYNPQNDLLRFTVDTGHGSEFEETLTLAFADVTPWSSNVVIRWGTYRIKFKIDVDREEVDRRIMADIHERLNDQKYHEKPVISAHIYMFAAEYYYNTDRDLEQALAWMNMAIEIEPVNYFFLYHSQILGALGRYDEAIQASTRGLALFMETGTNKEWIWRYEKQIAEWERVKDSRNE